MNCQRVLKRERGHFHEICFTICVKLAGTEKTEESVTVTLQKEPKNISFLHLKKLGYSTRGKASLNCNSGVEHGFFLPSQILYFNSTRVNVGTYSSVAWQNGLVVKLVKQT